MNDPNTQHGSVVFSDKSSQSIPDPIISIICNTYNHEKYIAQALDSFLMQKVNVPLEILVHDDASYDRTPEIIKQYEEQYPQIIKPILRQENQMSQGFSITADFQIPRAQGKYIAFCEGDDYWTDENKLQIQYDFMEAHPEYSMCCHAYNMVDKKGRLLEKRHDFSEDCIVPMERLIGNQLEVPHFATMFVRNEYLNGLGRTFLDKPCSDMIIRLYCAAKKNIYYLNRNMSCYRRFTEGSWTLRVGYDKNRFVKGQKQVLSFLMKYDEYTNYRYSQIIKKEIERRRFEICLYEKDYKGAKNNCFYKSASLKRRIGITFGCVFPNITKAFHNSTSSLRRFGVKRGIAAVVKRHLAKIAKWGG